MARAGAPARALAAVSVALALAALTGGAAEEWSLRKRSDEHDISVYSRRDASGLPAFRGVMHVEAGLATLVAVFTDAESMPRWMYRTRLVRRLEVTSETRLLAYTVNDLPWPFYDRDAVLEVDIVQESESHAVKVTLTGAPQRYPRQEGLVRMPHVEALWSFTPLGGGCVEVVFQGTGDPGGALSTPLLRWLLERVVWEAPFNTLRGLRAVVRESRYRGERPGFVREPPPRPAPVPNPCADRG